MAPPANTPAPPSARCSTDMRDDTQRLLLAALAVALYAATCLLPAWLQARRARRTAPPAGEGWLVAYASQTGNAQELAERTVRTLADGGVAAQACELDAVSTGMLHRTERALFIV